MNSTNYLPFRSLIAAAVAATLFAGCASVPEAPAGSAQVRAKLTALQCEPTLANRAPVAIKDAEAAVVRGRDDRRRISSWLRIASTSRTARSIPREPWRKPSSPKKSARH